MDSVIENMEQEDSFNGYRVSELREVFERHCSTEDWRNPFTVVVNNGTKNRLVEAIRYFLADEPVVREQRCYYRHPMGHVTMEFTDYIVSTKGYQAW